MKKIIALVLATVMLVFSLGALTSCGPKYETYFGDEFSPVNSQMDVLLQLNAKSIDVGVMDSVMAGYYMSQDTTYANSLMIIEDLILATEQYGIAARKGSGLTKMINKALVALANDGTVDTIAEKYGLVSEICIDKTATFGDLTADELTDWNYIKGEGKFIVGYTIFAPIAYEKDGELIGFDIELAKAVAEYLELDVEFQVIEWATKEAKLADGTIDLVWNGMTITEKRSKEMCISVPYLYNKQVPVVLKENATKYTTKDSMANSIMTAEKGSAGEEVIVEKKK